MKFAKRLAAFGAAMLLAVSAASSASARGWRHNGDSCGIVAAATLLNTTAEEVIAQLAARQIGPCVLMEEAGMLEDFRTEAFRLREERAANRGAKQNCAGENCPNYEDCTNREDCPNGENCPNENCPALGGQGCGNGLCDGSGQGYGNGGNGLCDGSGQGYGNGGNGLCDGSGQGRGNGHHGGGGHGCGRWK